MGIHGPPFFSIACFHVSYELFPLTGIRWISFRGFDDLLVISFDGFRGKLQTESIVDGASLVTIGGYHAEINVMFFEEMMRSVFD